MGYWARFFCPVCGHNHSVQKWAESLEPRDHAGQLMKSDGTSIEQVGTIPSYPLPVLAAIRSGC